MIRPNAVLFDCDGVIVDSEGPTLDLLLADLAAYGLPLTRHQLEADFIGGTIETVGQRATAAGARLPEDWVADFYTRMHAMLAEGVSLVPGILEVFNRLDTAGIPYAVGSNGPEVKLQISLGQHGLLPRFQGVFSGQAIGKPKPAPDIYLHAAAACGVRPNACIVIEDSPTGARAALAAGIPCLGFAAEGPDTPSAQGLAELDIPLFHHMTALPGLLGL